MRRKEEDVLSPPLHLPNIENEQNKKKQPTKKFIILLKKNNKKKLKKRNWQDFKKMSGDHMRSKIEHRGRKTCNDQQKLI